jgi:gamma-glutamyltranspeptidase/glutathione hydrolase
MPGFTRRELLALAASTLAARTIKEGREAKGSYGVAATEPPMAVRAAGQILSQGGNAFDAAVAAGLAACMIEPQMVDIGGYVCCAVILEGKSGRAYCLDANSISPAAARDGMYHVLSKSDRKGINENEYHCSVRDDANINGPHAVGVPGVMGGLGRLHEMWGRAKWSSLFQPSLDMLSNGMPFGSVANAIRVREAIIRRFPPAVKHLMPEGRLPKADDKWHRRDMEITLARLAQAGWRDFYEGELGRRIADHVQNLGGILTREDMRRFDPRIVAPYETTFRGARVFSGVLANGGLSVAQMLNMWEPLPKTSLNDPMYWHQLAEVGKLAWRDRLRYFGDGAAPERFLSKDYAAGRVETLRTYPRSVDRQSAPPADMSPGTTNITAADAEGNMVAMTISHGGSFGSCVTVPDTGITLGHGMCRFDPRPGRPNSAGPRKHPLNNVCPTILRLSQRDVACGLRGGRRIVNVASHICRQIIEHDVTGLEAVTSSRLHVEEQGPIEVTRNMNEAIVSELRSIGHEVNIVDAVGGPTNACERLHDGTLRAASNVSSVAVS